MKRSVALGVVAVLSLCSCDGLRELKLKRAAGKACTIPALKSLEAGPYLRGKLAVVDASTHRWEPLVGNYLPDDLAPQTFDDVKMCVVIEWARKAVGEYQVTGTDSQGRPTNRGTQVAVAQNCHVTLVDLTTHAVIAENDFEGRVAERIRSDTPDIGDNAKPIEELEAWLFKLPRKP